MARAEDVAESNMITKSTAQNILLVLISVCITLLSLELVLRIRGGILFRFDSFTAPANPFSGMEYDSRLGWIPRPGRYGSDWTSNVDSLGLRDNGRSMAATGRPILAVGDSFTFGNEVEDNETWPAYLEEILNKRVINAGVGAYGGPFRTLTANEQDQFVRGRAVFDMDFGFDDGAGALAGADGVGRFNGDSCRACHFDPVIGGAGPRDVNVMRHGIVNGDGVFSDPPTTPNTILHKEIRLGPDLVHIVSSCI